MHYIYILLLNNNQIYTGSTANLKERIIQHKNGKVSFTSKRLPIKLLFYEAFLEKEDTVRREKYLKTSKGKSTLRMMLKVTLEKALSHS